eukprot:9097821-Pyramimonas_sp.AAC.1
MWRELCRANNVVDVVEAMWSMLRGEISAVWPVCCKLGCAIDVVGANEIIGVAVWSQPYGPIYVVQPALCNESRLGYSWAVSGLLLG